MTEEEQNAQSFLIATAAVLGAQMDNLQKYKSLLQLAENEK